MTLDQLRNLASETSSKQMIYYILEYLEEKEAEVMTKEEYDRKTNDPFGVFK